MFKKRLLLIIPLVWVIGLLAFRFMWGNPPIIAANRIPKADSQDDPQNVILIIADDFGVDMTALYNEGSSDLPPTPNIDALLANGVLFENAWTNPLCSPTRAAMLTGRYGFRNGIGTPIEAADDGIAAEEFTLPEAISAGTTAGYTHANIGKWHLSTQASGGRLSPLNAGYDHFQGLLRGGLDTYYAYDKNTNGVTATSTTYATTDTVDDAISWLDTQNEADKPWFLWVAFNAPHSPFHLPPADLHSFDSLSGNQNDIDNDPLPYYKAMVEAMDSEIGRLLTSFPADVLENTTIIFLGDNGTPGQVVQSPLTRQTAKGSLYQGGIHVPMIVSGPQVVNPNRRSSALVNSVDIYATVLELIGVDLEGTVPETLTLDSVTMLPYIADTAHPSPREWLYAEQFDEGVTDPDYGQAIRNSRYKLILFEDSSIEFYDLQTDEHEGSDLLQEPSGLSSTEEQNYCSLYNELITLLESEPGQSAPTLPSDCDGVAQATETPSPSPTFTSTPAISATSDPSATATAGPEATATPALDIFTYLPWKQWTEE